MYKYIKYFSIDIETTGLDEKECDIIQFSAIYEDPKLQLPFEEIPKFNRYIKHKFYKGQDYALWLNSDILLKLSKYKDSWTEEEKAKSQIVTSYLNLWQNFGDWVRKITGEKSPKIWINAAGKNFGTFDLQFIKQHVPFDGALDVKFRSRILDPAELYVNDEDESLPGMEKCLERAGITRQKHKDGGIVTHDAIMDCWDVITLLRLKY